MVVKNIMDAEQTKREGEFLILFSILNFNRRTSVAIAANTDICEQITKYKTINTILRMIYHFSAKFNNDPHTYHGEFDAIYEPDRINDAVKERILRQAKNELLNKMRGDWQKEDKDIIMYQVYTHNRPFDRKFQNKVNEMRGGDGSEIMLFEYKK